MVALVAVSTLLVATVNSYTTSLKTVSEVGQLKDLLKHIAAKGNEILTLAAVTNSSIQVFLQVPAVIGYQQYWLRVRNDSSTAWVEGSLGQMVENEVLNQVFLPKGTSASGCFVGGYGPAVLESYMNGSTPQLNLASLGG